MAQHQQKIVPVILSGGSGSRLWPLSRDLFPKQFIGVIDQKTPLIRETLQRIEDKTVFYPPLLIGNEAHRFLLSEELNKSGFDNANIIIEPYARSTAPAIAVAALLAEERYGETYLLVLPTDHAIKYLPGFKRGVAQALQTAMQNYLVTFGVEPLHAETGYGYIKRGKVVSGLKNTYQIASFVEKPSTEKAEAFIASKEYFWNSGMFLLPTTLLLEEMEKWQPGLLHICRQSIMHRSKDLSFIRLDADSFRTATDISIDYAIMEKTHRAAVVDLDCGWSDTGAWDLLWKLAEHDKMGNATIGKCYIEASKNNYIRNERGPAIATLGVEDLVIVSTKDAVLVADKNHAQSLKNLTSRIRKEEPDLIYTNRHVFRPWGMYENIHEGSRFQVKRLTVKPGEKLSIQMHHHRSEHWIVVSGTGRMSSGDFTKLVTENESFYVPCGAVHSIENPGKINLDIIEVQVGSYLGEDDIVRFEDRYGRSDNDGKPQN